MLSGNLTFIYLEDDSIPVRLLKLRSHTDLDHHVNCYPLDIWRIGYQIAYLMLSGNLTFIYLEDSSLHGDLNQYDFSASGASQVCYLDI
jgi:hypothetical protein